MSDDFAIKVDNVSKTFKLPHEKQNSIKGSLVSLVKGGKRTYEKQEVLKNVSFEINKGEFFGIVGRNGSGKSTLLKMLAGIYTPTEGQIHVRGKLTPFIELGVGFNPELTGRENVFLNGALLGFNRKEMEAMYRDIVAFAEIERFMDQKLKNYSSGMQVRLAFAIAIRAETDILLLDEVLAVGDEAFQRKCYAYFEDLKRDKKTVILVTHDMAAVEKFCDRAMLIEKGDIVEGGDPKLIARAYSELFSAAGEEPTAEKSAEPKKRWGNKKITFEKISVNSRADTNPRIEVVVQLKARKVTSGPLMMAYTVKNKERNSLFGDSFEILSGEVGNNGSHTCTFSFRDILSRGEYYLDLSLREPMSEEYCDFWVDSYVFKSSSKKDNALNILVDSKIEEVA